MTTTMQIAGLYVMLNALITFLLAINVVRHRMRTKTVIGDGGDEKLLLAQRAHGNNIEYTPIMLVMLITLALLNTSALIIHILGGTLVTGRLLHGYGITLSSTDTNFGRAVGATLTWAVMIAMIVFLALKVYS